MTAGFVYFLQADNGHVKIGRSISPSRRCLELAGSVSGLAVLHEIRTDDMVWLEGFLHGAFHASRVWGEWFDLSPSDVAALTAIPQWDRPVDGTAGSGRTVVMLPEDVRAALRSVALERDVEMGDVVHKALLLDSDISEALERIRRNRKGRKKGGAD